jgi:peroxiredoxin
MSLVNSTMPELGMEAPDFSLFDSVSGRLVSLADFDGKKGLLMMFICNHCPYVARVADQLTLLGRDYPGKGIGVAAVACTDLKQVFDDSPSEMKKEAKARGWRFPYMFDEGQQVAKAYKAACTPDFFLFDGDRKLYYRGRLDEARPNNAKPCDGADLRAALDALLAGKPAPQPQRPSGTFGSRRLFVYQFPRSRSSKRCPHRTRASATGLRSS